MARTRKTVAIETLKTEINRRNRESTCSADTRSGWNSLLETMLMTTGNYNGFAFLTPDKVPTGAAPGIRKDAGAHPLAIGNDNASLFKGTDATRRRYF